MLAELRIRGLGVIERAELTLGPGLTVVTGETGAGKTMVVHSLGLLLGGRSDPGLVRSGSSRAMVEARVSGLHPDALRRAMDAGAELEEGDLLAGRSVGAEGGRSRAWLGGAAVPAAVLGEVTGSTLVVHGQHDQQRLVRPGEQRAALDRFGGAGLAAALRGYQRTYAQWHSAVIELDELKARAVTRLQEVELLRAGLARIGAVAPEPAEDVRLRARADRLRNASELQGAAEAARELLAGDSGSDAAGLAGAARRALEQAAVHDPDLGDLALRAAEVTLLAADLAADLASYSDRIDSDPVGLASIEDRRSELSSLTRMYGPDVDAALAWAVAAQARLDELDGTDERLAVLTHEVSRLDAGLTTLAAALTDERNLACELLSAAVEAELAGLAMAQARLSVVVRPADRGRHGCDDVEFVLSAHNGAPPRPIARSASGGELSRVMLAVEVVLAEAGDAATLVFDEVDAGVGGRAAVEVGRRLARLARTHQVICVTHLPQVAAFADAHLRVVRSSSGAVTETDVQVLDDSARVRELSRMLGGLEASNLGQGHARELLDLAAAAKATS